jgi:polyphosphate glucokinase
MPARTTPRTLAIDIGGTGLKAGVLGPRGALLTDRARVETAYPCTPQSLVAQLATLVAPLPPADRISVGFPGVVRGGKVLTAPNLSRKSPDRTDPLKSSVEAWHGFDLARAIARRFKLPAMVVNDADLQGLSVASGKGIEVVITLGTGFGTAVLRDGQLGPHLELAHHPFRKGETYDEQLGDDARKSIGKKAWNRRLATAISNLQVLFNYDHLYIGGGNTRHITLELAPNVTVIDPNAGILGGIRLWDQRHV